MANLFVLPYQTLLDSGGLPISGGKLYAYLSGTSTPQDVYSDDALTTPHTNPVIADSAGRLPPVYLGNGDYKFIVKDASDVTIKTTDPVHGLASSAGGGGSSSSFAGVKNAVINGDASVHQLVSNTVGANDNAYVSDMVRILSEANGDFTYQRVANPYTSVSPAPFIHRLRVAVGNKKGALIFLIPNDRTLPLRGQTVTVSAMLQADSTIGDVRMAVMEWTGTADATTADPIATWPAGSGNPTLNANWSFRNTPSILTVGTSAGFISITTTVSASANNLAVLIFNNDQTTTIGDDIDMGDVQLEVSSQRTAYERRSFLAEIQECMRFYQKSFDYTVAPAQNASDTNNAFHVSQTGANSLSHDGYYLPFKVPMNAAPTVTTYNPAAANAQFRNLSASQDTSVTAASPGKNGAKFSFTSSAGSSERHDNAVHWSADARL